MSGELQVVFIYDTLRCRKEEDDPREAILYFHPEGIPESRRLAICGQLMGITHFLISSYSAPKILTLENGKFALRDFGKQYVLALGCSSVTPDWLLDKQADILYDLTRFFHKDIDNILKTVDGNRRLLSTKLASIMDHYIPISQHHGDLFALTFGILPILNLPKSANHISLNATVILQTCMLRDGVLGGIVMFQNKVIGVELIQEIAQKLAFIQPYQLPPADSAKMYFALPPGVQLLKVYVRQQDLESLKRHSSTYQYPGRCEPNILQGKENSLKGKIDPIREEEDMSSSLGFSEPSSESNNPSEELQNSLTYSSLDVEGDVDDPKGSLIRSSVNNSQNDNITSEKRLSGTIDAVERWKVSDVAPSGVDIDEFNPSRKFSRAGPAPTIHKIGCGSNFLHPPRTYRSLEDFKVIEELNEEGKKTLSTSLTDPFFPYSRCDGKAVSKLLMDSYSLPGQSPEDAHLCHQNSTTYNHSVPKNQDLHLNSTASATNSGSGNKDPVVKEYKGVVEVILPEKVKHSDVINYCEEAKEINSNTISSKRNDKEFSSESSFFKTGGKGISRPKDLALNLSSSTTRSKSKRRWSTFDDMMSPVIENPSVLIELQSPATGRREKSSSFSNTDSEYNTTKSQEYCKIDAKSTSENRPNSLLNSFRKKSSPEEDFSNSFENESKPLKLTSLLKPTSLISPTDNKSASSSSSLEKLAKDKRNSTKNQRIPVKATTAADRLADVYEDALLFIYSLGGMRLLLLLDKQSTIDAELIQSLWDYGSSSIAELEVAVSNIEEQSMSMGGGHHDHYCYLHYEPVWRSLAHGGRNHSMDFDVVQHMHQDFQIYPKINELIIRGEDHVVYGYQCVGSEVFYQQSAGPQPGLPMPSDLMGKVPLKAKRRLERDHNILLL